MNKGSGKKVVKVSKEILKYLLLGGAVFIAASSPYFVLGLVRELEKSKKFKREKVETAFQYLRRRGLIEIKKKDHDVIIGLTEKGKKRARKYQIDDLEIKTPKKWDKKWRVVIFDIPHFQRTERDALRRKLKELGFCPLQKSVWIYSYDCKREVGFLREFFGLDKNQIQVLLVEKIEDDKKIKKFFDLG